MVPLLLSEIHAPVDLLLVPVTRPGVHDTVPALVSPRARLIWVVPARQLARVPGNRVASRPSAFWPGAAFRRACSAAARSLTEAAYMST